MWKVSIGKIFKIFVDNKTSLLKIELLPQKLPTGVTKKLLDVVQTETALANLQKEDYVSLFSSENIVGKKQVKASRVTLYPFAASTASGAIIGVEEMIEPGCNEFPGWNDPGLCYMRTSYRAHLEMLEIGAPLDACFYQVRNKVDNQYIGPEVWQVVDCNGKFNVKPVQLPMDIGPEGDCYTYGPEACQAMVILNKQNNIMSVGSRIYNINYP